MQSKDYAKARLTKINARLEELEVLLSSLPKGKLSFSKSRGKLQFYQLIGNKNDADYSRNYLGSSKRDIAALLAQKELYKEEYADLLTERDSLLGLLHAQNRTKPRLFIEKLGGNADDFCDLIRSGNSNNPEKLWALSPYSSSAPNPEGRNIRAIDGTMVRSKSEVEIISTLVKYNLSYRYECDLFYNGRIIGCPDFMIMHPITREIFVWEHFGILDNLNYVRRNIYKVQSYIEAGFYPMINFIITSETAARPFDITLADSLIRQFFLQ